MKKTPPPPPPSKASKPGSNTQMTSAALVAAARKRGNPGFTRAIQTIAGLKRRKTRRAQPKSRALKPLLAAALRACPRKPSKVETDLIAAYCGIAIKGATTFARKTLDYGTDNIAGGGTLGIVVRARDKIARMLNLAGKTAVHESKVDSAEDLHVYGAILLLAMLGLWPDMTTNPRLAL